MRTEDWEIITSRFYTEHKFAGWPEWGLLPLSVRRMWAAAYRGAAIRSSSTELASAIKADHQRWRRKMVEK